MVENIEYNLSEIVDNSKINLKHLFLNAKFVETNNINYNLSYNFNTYYSDNVEKLYDPKRKLRTQFKGRNKVYKIVSPYYHTIPETTNTIQNAFKKKYKHDTTDQDFYKLWECLHKYNLMSNIKSANYSDRISEQCMNIMKIKKSDKKFDCLLYNDKSKLNTRQEINYLQKFIEILQQLRNLNKNGSMIVKIYTTYTTNMVQLLYLLTHCFKSCYIYFPLTNDKYKSDRYLICKDFNDIKINDKYINFIEKLKATYLSYNINIPIEFIKYIRDMNLKTMIVQTKAINELEKYILDNNYYGDEYNEFRNKQIESTQKWIKTYT